MSLIDIPPPQQLAQQLTPHTISPKVWFILIRTSSVWPNYPKQKTVIARTAENHPRVFFWASEVLSFLAESFSSFELTGRTSNWTKTNHSHETFVGAGRPKEQTGGGGARETKAPRMKHKYYRLLPKTARAGREEFGDNTIRPDWKSTFVHVGKSFTFTSRKNQKDIETKVQDLASMYLVSDVNLVLFMYIYVLFRVMSLMVCPLVISSCKCHDCPVLFLTQSEAQRL